MDLLNQESKIILNCNRLLNFLYYKKGIEFFEVNINDEYFKNQLDWPPNCNDPTPEEKLNSSVNFVKDIILSNSLGIFYNFSLIYMAHFCVMVHRDKENPSRSYAYVKALLGIKFIVPPKPEFMCQRIEDRFWCADAFKDLDLMGIARYLGTYEEVRGVWHNMLLNSTGNTVKDHSFQLFSEKNNEEDFWWSPFINSLYNPSLSLSQYSPLTIYELDEHFTYFEGLNFRLLPSKPTILINLIKIFMEIRNLFVEDGWVFQLSNKGSSESRKIIKLEKIFDFSEVLVITLRHKFPNQVDEEDLNLLIFEAAEESLRRILAIPSLLPQRPKEFVKLLASISKIKDGLITRKGGECELAIDF